MAFIIEIGWPGEPVRRARIESLDGSEQCPVHAAYREGCWACAIAHEVRIAKIKKGNKVMTSTFKCGAIRLVAEVRGCEPIVMELFGWLWPWPFEVRSGGQVIAVCVDHATADQAVLDFLGSEQAGT